MKKIVGFSFSIMLHVLCTVSMAQPYTIKNLGMKDGIPSNYVQDITQDAKGYIWISTPSGLSRFDGHKFIVYGQDNPEFSQSWQDRLLSDPTGNRIWVATNEGTFYFDYSSEKVKRQELPSDKQRGVITGLAPSTDNGVWITHSSYGVMHFSAQEVKSYTPQNIKGLPTDFSAAVDNGKGYLYIGHSENGLSVVDMKEHSCKNFKHNPNDPEGLPSNEINVIFIDKSHNIWLGTNKGLVWFNPQKESFTTFKHSETNEKSLLADQVTDIAQMDDGKLWICTYLGGISIFDFQNNAFSSPQEVEFLNISPTNNEYGLSSPNAKGIIQDSFGNIWIANYRGGIDFISHTNPLFKTITHIDTSSSRQIWGLWADKTDKIWLGGEGELNIYRTKLLQKREMRKDIVIELSYKGFSRASDYS